MKHIKTISHSVYDKNRKKTGCNECHTSCQSACKTSCTVANQSCSKG